MNQQKKKEPIDNETQLKLLNTICFPLRCKIHNTFQFEIQDMCSEYEIKQNDFIREVCSDLIQTITTMMKDINPTEYKTFMTYPSLNEFDWQNQRSTEYIPN